MQTEALVSLASVVLGGGVSLLVCVALVLTQSLHGRFSMDGTDGVQKMHSHPTPRIGGVAVLLGLMAALGGLVRFGHPQLPVQHETIGLMTATLLAAMPAFVFGLVEDLTKRVSVRVRLIATIASGVLAWWLTGYTLTRVDTWGLDWLVQWLPISVMFTAFCVGGIANAVNIVDGFNGLSAGTLILCFSTIAAIAGFQGDAVLVQMALSCAAVMLGFGLMNFPLGKIFLGDGGAYTAGFLLAWFTVLLPMRNPEVSVWASVLICGYPTLEVFYSVMRRSQRAGHHPGQPDKAHLHHLVFGRVAKPRFRRFALSLQNGMVSPYMWCAAAIPCVVALLFYRNTATLILGFLGCALLYRVVYLRLVHFRWPGIRSIF